MSHVGLQSIMMFFLKKKCFVVRYSAANNTLQIGNRVRCQNIGVIVNRIQKSMRSVFARTHRTFFRSKFMLSCCHDEILFDRSESAAKRIGPSKADETLEQRQMYVSEDR
jgi:hypothetical protein